MGNEWPMVAIGEVAEVFDGPHATPKTIEYGPIFLGIGALQNGRIQLGETRHVSLDDFKIWTRRVKPKGGDVVFSYETRLGEAAIIPDGFECCLGRRMALVRADRTRLEPRFFLFQFLSPRFQELIRSRTIPGATVDRIALKEFPSFVIPLPPLEEQRAIAHILGTLDDKIELNRKQNETLEAMARTLFKAWFVDFEPVRAKLEGRWQRGQSLPGLPAHLFDLFPDRLVESELGSIPDGWEIGRVSDYLSLAYGKSLPAGSRNAGNVPVYGSGGVTGFHDAALVDDEAVIVGRKGTVGSLYWEQLPSFPIDTVFFVQPFVSLPFCYHLLESLPLRDMNTDAAVPGLNRENVYRLEVALPHQELVEKFSLFARSLRNQIFAQQNETHHIAQLRDTLLPKLISGELRVPDAERIAGRVA